MRLVSAVLFVALMGSGARADETNPADAQPEVTQHKVPFRVVKMLPETGQVLLFDRNRGNHVVAEVGQSLEGYFVDDIDAEAVTLVAANGTQIILAAPPPRRPLRRAARTERGEQPGEATAQPADPYGEAPPAGGAVHVASAAGVGSTANDANDANDADAKPSAMPVDPYAKPAGPTTPGEGGVRVASAAATGADPISAPDDPYGDPGIAAFVDAVGATPAPSTSARPSSSTAATSARPTGAPPAPSGAEKTAPAPTTPVDDTGSALAAALTGGSAPSSSSAPAPAAPPPPSAAWIAGSDPISASSAASPSAGTSATLARGELDAALADFGALASTFKATFTAKGLRFDTIRAGSLLTRIGLRTGDVITSVDGQPLRSLDDAADLYARASSLRAATIQLDRAGTPLTLRVAIR